MQTNHNIFFSNSNNMQEIKDDSVHLIVTSPPYPMIEMWDGLFNVKFQEGEYYHAYYLMHEMLNEIWTECYRILCDGGIACINIGDACRTLGGNFYYFVNHATIVEFCVKLGFQCLPSIVWRKPSNKPNKFMGSGMLPPSAYPTLEQEYIMLFRKGNKRTITNVDMRRKSAYFWEERNIWFSDCWENIRGIKQQMKDNAPRSRNAAFPIEIPLRLIQMFSIYGDVVVDPFFGTGSTSIAAMMTCRNSAGYEINSQFKNEFESRLNNIQAASIEYNQNRLINHSNFVLNREAQGKNIKHYNENHKVKVITSQEKEIQLFEINEVDQSDNYKITYQTTTPTDGKTI